VRCWACFPFLLPSPAEPPYERHGSELSRVGMSPQQPLERRWGDFEAPPRVPNLWLVRNDDFRPAASHIRSSSGKADCLSARIGPHSQREQVGETEGSLDV
jgi:hypothetical protein